tara:strand:- start:2288 stop:2455 length:168 start_codon:yes stop_codon:yes gene_type:complete
MPVIKILFIFDCYKQILEYNKLLYFISKLLLLIELFFVLNYDKKLSQNLYLNEKV